VAASSSGAGAGASAPKKATGALDKVLSDIKGPQAISTVAKSSYDWESFKEEENLEDDLAKATKDGYVRGCGRCWLLCSAVCVSVFLTICCLPVVCMSLQVPDAEGLPGPLRHPCLRD
jgi:hypothetical protein